MSIHTNPIPSNIPPTILSTLETLEKAGFEAFLVGGCVRDLLLNRKPQDWDITTNAMPEQILALFNKTFYENSYGTVGVVNEDVTDKTLKIIEITPYRKEGKYSDNRHPDVVLFCDSIYEDLARRDFTINAMAMNNKGEVIDPHKGQKDLSLKEIKCVGDPDLRFEEDALRILRAIRFSAQLRFMINTATEKSILKKGELLKNISKERIRDEFIKVISCEIPSMGLSLFKQLKIMSYILPELEESYDIRQNKAHTFDVWNHLIRSLQCAADKDWPLYVRLAALFHDIGKPRSRRWSPEKKEWTFYGHDVVGAKMTKKILYDLKFPKLEINSISFLGNFKSYKIFLVILAPTTS